MDLYIEKLAECGLTKDDAKNLGIDFLTKEGTQALSLGAFPSLKLNYYGYDGCPLNFYRLRYLGGGAVRLRYIQPKNTRPYLYIPKNFNWLGLLDDIGTPIYITEGELKAAKACKMGYPTLGLGGVQSFRAFKIGVDFLPEFNTLNLRGREIYVIFDSDYQTNSNVCKALSDFCEELDSRGAYAKIVTLPTYENGTKMGLDDYLCRLEHSEGASWKEEFSRLLSVAEPYGLAKVLLGFNKKYCAVSEPPAIASIDNGVLINVNNFKSIVESRPVYWYRTLTKDGFTTKKTSAATEWLKYPLRNSADKLVYLPAQEKLVYSKGARCFNTWKGWGVEPKKGDVKPFLDLVEHLFKGDQKEAKEWFLKWCGYPIKFAGSKLYSAVIMYGLHQGTGKTLLGYTLGRIYGENFSEISSIDLGSNFNEWAVNKQFIVGDELSGDNNRTDIDKLKKLITQSAVRINQKNVSSYELDDCINYYLTTNRPDALKIDQYDRRFFVHEIKSKPLRQDFYTRYDAWLNAGGAAHLFYFFLHMPYEDFDPKAKAYSTSAKEEMSLSSMSETELWCHELMLAPETKLFYGRKRLKKDLFSAKELFTLYNVDGKSRLTKNGLNRILVRTGVKKVLGGANVYAVGSSDQYFILRNHDIWEAEDLADNEVRDHLNLHADDFARNF